MTKQESNKHVYIASGISLLAYYFIPVYWALNPKPMGFSIDRLPGILQFPFFSFAAPMIVSLWLAWTVQMILFLLTWLIGAEIIKSIIPDK